ncbi:hypothetical protein [Novosphingobium sp. Fuku2-ISO-50]|uniref:hypothetical protein n=1 Tax=Novosphingobium sp. Fuku2-ISO-50 TaxID=1739114 RepID=UPI00076C4BDD|nr:hypothetical protein [Novosphingobium sp. Fuku2-ISO-50]KUR75023.1 hypothetical protein AQZ50_16505 [Novosphingobium sp. Fuku2-ISO-50]
MSAGGSDPFDLPEWQAIHREASLVRQLIGSGTTALGRASYGSGLGEYYTAFFGLSVGIERLAKLILVADFAMDNAGALPGQNEVRKFGHKIRDLCDRAEQISTNRGLQLDFPKPTDPICWAVVDCLDAFADARKGRYANFEAIGNPAFDAGKEPVNKWWTDVVEPILAKHVRGTAREAVIRHNAEMVDAFVGHSVFVLHVDETGKPMNDVLTASWRTGMTKWAQTYGRLYTLTMVRWLADIFSTLSREGGHGGEIIALYGHYELFFGYLATDKQIKNYKIWPLI